MKKILYITFFLSPTFLLAQNNFQGKVIYKIGLENVDYSFLEKDSTRSEKTEKMAISILKNLKDAQAILKFTATESIYEPIKKMENDKGRGVDLTSILAGKGKVYVNNISKEVLYQKDFMGELFLVEYQPLQWQLTQEVKQIGNYACYKATTTKTIKSTKGVFEREIVAWYTPQIPVNFGPREYNGLPGLIIELAQEKLKFLAIKIELNPTEKIEIKKPTKGKKVTQQEFEEIGLNAMSGFRKGL